MKEAEELDLPKDASLRVRMWWEFWLGWRKAMIALVVLVTAWWTNPGPMSHGRRIQESIARARVDQDPTNAYSSRQALQSILNSNPSPQQMKQWRYVAENCNHRTILILSTTRFRTVGLLGFVWTLD